MHVFRSVLLVAFLLHLRRAVPGNAGHSWGVASGTSEKQAPRGSIPALISMGRAAGRDLRPALRDPLTPGYADLHSVQGAVSSPPNHRLSGPHFPLRPKNIKSLFPVTLVSVTPPCLCHSVSFVLDTPSLFLTGLPPMPGCRCAVLLHAPFPARQAPSGPRFPDQGTLALCWSCPPTYLPPPPSLQPGTLGSPEPNQSGVPGEAALCGGKSPGVGPDRPRQTAQPV